MAGLLQQGMNPQQQPQQPAQPPQQPTNQQAPQQGQAQGAGPMAPPEQAKPMVGALVNRLLTFLYEEATDRVTEALNRDGNITQQMGEIIGMIMVTVYNAMAQQGKTIPPNVMVQAGMELSKAIGEMAQRMGRIPEGQDAEAIESAFMMGLGKLGKNAADGSMTPEQRQAYAQMVDALMKGREQAQGGQRPQQAQQPAQPMNGGQ